jgi:serine/threonine protein kinase
VNQGLSPDFWNPNGIGKIICGIVFGMRAVHEKRLIHGNLKPSNILIDKSGQALIGDFGTSRLEIDDATFTGDTGTVHYAAPEMFKDDPYTNKVDVFSFGLILYEILVGSAVFQLSEARFPIMRRILTGDMPEIPARCGPFMQNLIPRCWSLNPGDRPSFEEILDEFRLWDFAIIPDADSDKLRSFAWGITAWEDGNSRLS